jgi:protein-tyrosine phosphatase
VTPTVIDALVEPEGGGLVVRWTLDGDDVGVDIGVGPGPEAIDHVHTHTVPAGERSVRIDDVSRAPGRHYVSVAPHGGGGAVVAAERRVPFEGVTNFRDLGGYRTTSGRRTRWGLVFRSDALHRFTSEDRRLYEALGLHVVYDLRNDDERGLHPNPFASTQITLLSRDADAPLPDRSDWQDADAGERMLREMYGGLLANAGPTFGRLLAGLAEPEALPAVIHCTGGKDRTGMAAALLLELLGVPRQQVLDDYELTSRYRLREHQTESLENMLAAGMAPEAAAAVLGCPRWAMAGALEELDDRYRGIDAYLTGPAGLAPATLERLRGTLVY